MVEPEESELTLRYPPQVTDPYLQALPGNVSLFR